VSDLTRNLKQKAFDAWQSGKCTDDELTTCINSLAGLIDTLGALRVQGIVMQGFYTTLHSMTSAMESRNRDRAWASRSAKP
jgi:hypothetical protein